MTLLSPGWRSLKTTTFEWKGHVFTHRAPKRSQTRRIARYLSFVDQPNTFSMEKSEVAFSCRPWRPSQLPWGPRGRPQWPFVPSLSVVVSASWSQGLPTVEDRVCFLDLFFLIIYCTLPETNMAPENSPWKRRFLLETIIFRDYISFRESMYFLFQMLGSGAHLLQGNYCISHSGLGSSKLPSRWVYLW